MSQTGDRLAVLAPMRLEQLAIRRGARSARVLRTGTGPERAVRAVARGLGSDAAVLAVAGVCGSVDAELVPGTTLVATEVRGQGGAHPCCAPETLVAALAEWGIRAEAGPIQSVDHVVLGSERGELRAGGALAVDMESVWLAEGARGRPLAVLRTVLDAPGRELLRPSLLWNGWRALAALEAAIPALEAWAADQVPTEKR